MAPSRGGFRPALALNLLGLAGLAVFGAFVLLLGLGLWQPPLVLPASWAWPINLGWLLLFALQHSGMARTGFKRWWTRIVPATLERPLYILVSGLLVLGLALTWQPLPGEPFWSGPVWLSLIALAGGGASAALVLWTGWREFLGLALSASPGEERLVTSGPYRLVRHPQMLAVLVFLWAQPILSPGLLLLSGGLTVYILVALPLEERDLRQRFGREYEEYRRRVPALIPWR